MVGVDRQNIPRLQRNRFMVIPHGASWGQVKVLVSIKKKSSNRGLENTSRKVIEERG